MRIRTYPSCEWYGMVIVWFDRDGGEPDLAPTGGARARGRRLLPATPALAHGQPGEGAPADDRGERRRPVPHRARCTTVTVRLRRPASSCTSTTSTPPWTSTTAGATVDLAHPDGPVDGEVVYDTFGLGIGFVRFPPQVLASVQITGHTPVDEEFTDYFFTMSCRARRG